MYCGEVHLYEKKNLIEGTILMITIIHVHKYFKVSVLDYINQIVSRALVKRNASNKHILLILFLT